MTRNLQVLVAILAAVALAVLAISFQRDQVVDAADEFARALIESIRVDSDLHREFLSSDDLAELPSNRDFLSGNLRRVLVDETWGAWELGYCFPSGAFVYLTMATNPSPPKPAQVSVHAPKAFRSEICTG